MNQTTIDRLGKAAADAAIYGAVEFVRSRKIENPDLEKLAAATKAAALAALPGALDDAEEAFNAGMTQVATTTFLATMRLAGIRAAQEVLA